MIRKMVVMNGISLFRLKAGEKDSFVIVQEKGGFTFWFLPPETLSLR